MRYWVVGLLTVSLLAVTAWLQPPDPNCPCYQPWETPDGSCVCPEDEPVEIIYVPVILSGGGVIGTGPDLPVDR